MYPHFGRPQSSLSANEDRRVRMPHSSNPQSEEESVGSYKNIRCPPPSVPHSEASPQYACNPIRVPQSSLPHSEDPQILVPQISAPKNEDGPQSSLPQFMISFSQAHRSPNIGKSALSQPIINRETTSFAPQKEFETFSNRMKSEDSFKYIIEDSAPNIRENPSTQPIGFDPHFLTLSEELSSKRNLDSN